MQKVLLMVVALLITMSAVVFAESYPVSKIGIESDKEFMRAVDIPTYLDDPRLKSETQEWYHDTTGWCVGLDGNPVQLWSNGTLYTMEISVPELNFWNMNNLHVSVKFIDEDTGMPRQGYSDYGAEKDPDRGIIILSVAIQNCYSGSPGEGYWDDEGRYICGPIEGGGCWTDFLIAEKALISIKTHKYVK